VKKKGRDTGKKTIKEIKRTTVTIYQFGRKRGGQKKKVGGVNIEKREIRWIFAKECVLFQKTLLINPGRKNERGRNGKSWRGGEKKKRKNKKGKKQKSALKKGGILGGQNPEGRGDEGRTKKTRR